MIGTLSLALVTLLTALPSFGGVITSTLPSTVPGLSIPNAHSIDQFIYRGNQPLDKVSELKRFGISDVIIIKQDIKGEVPQERASLNSLQIHSYYIPMRWNISTPVQSCEETVEAVNLALSLRAQNRKIYIHCSAGEDRTGLVSGLLRMQLQSWSAQKAFTDEMCAHGYADSSNGKPPKVVQQILQNLNPIFLLLSKSLSAGRPLSKDLCRNAQDASLNAPSAQLSCKKNRI